MRAASWDVVPVALALASVIGLATLFILEAADYAQQKGMWDDVSWVMFSLGGILAFMTGTTASWSGAGGEKTERCGWERSGSRGSRPQFSLSSFGRR